MNRPTSKSAYLDIKESGAEMSQESKILEIISIGGSWSLQEILAAYRAKYGKIELSSVSARCNKLKADGKIFEGSPRKCGITDKTINPLMAERQKGLGEWNSWVEGGKDKAEQLARYHQAPEHMRPQIASHMKTVQLLKPVQP